MAEAEPGLLVCGGGAAGLMAAIAAASAFAERGSGGGGRAGDGRRLRVLLLEKMPSCGRKLLASGSGQCNLTHSGDAADFEERYGEHGKFLRPALRAFSNQAVIEFFSSRGCALETEAGGKVFPASRRARDVLSVLEAECAALGVELQRGRALLSARALPGGGFHCSTADAELRTRTLCLATGGLSYPGTGSTGEGHALAAALGHRIEETGPALTALIARGYSLASCAGISLSGAGFAVRRAGRIERRLAGDILLTHRGLSGPGILDASRWIKPGDLIELCLLGTADEAGADALLQGRLRGAGAKALSSALAGLLPSRLLEAVMASVGVEPSVKAASLRREDRRALARVLAAFPLEVQALEGYETAMATRGGVCLEEIDPKTMMSRIAPGLFFAGELLDLDGDTGGYNIQAAFSSGWLAGRSAASF